MIFNIAPGMNEVIIREGAAPKVLDPKARHLARAGWWA